jgi:DNA-binding NtrC family response regulator
MAPTTMARTVLVVDDDAMIRRAIVRALDGEPYTTLSVSSADEAIALLARTPVDLLLSDHCMPGMSGIALLEIVKSRYPNIVRMMLTSDEEASVFVAALRDGSVRRFMRKPWDDDELREVLRQALRVSAPREREQGARRYRSNSVIRFLGKLGIRE